MTEPLRLGGMALRNGLLVHGPTSWAAAVRAPDGTLHAASGRKPELPAVVLRAAARARRRAHGRDARAAADRAARAARGAPAVRGRARRGGRRRRPRSRRAGCAGASSRPGRVGVARRVRRPRAPARRAALVARARRLPRRRAQGDRRLRARRRTPSTPPRSTSAAARTSSARSSPRPPPANLLAARLPERARKAGRLGGSLVAMGVAVEVFAWADRNRGTRISNLFSRPGFAFQRARRDRGALGRAARGRGSRPRGAAAGPRALGRRGGFRSSSAAGAAIRSEADRRRIGSALARLTCTAEISLVLTWLPVLLLGLLVYLIWRTVKLMPKAAPSAPLKPEQRRSAGTTSPASTSRAPS